MTWPAGWLIPPNPRVPGNMRTRLWALASSKDPHPPTPGVCGLFPGLCRDDSQASLFPAGASLMLTCCPGLSPGFRKLSSLERTELPPLSAVHRDQVPPVSLGPQCLVPVSWVLGRERQGQGENALRRKAAAAAQ